MSKYVVPAQERATFHLVALPVSHVFCSEFPEKKLSTACQHSRYLTSERLSARQEHVAYHVEGEYDVKATFSEG
jgi:hypothetical protein